MSVDRASTTVRDANARQTKPNIRALDMMVLDDLFEMGGGFVLRFSDRTFAQFFSEELGVNIDDPKYLVGGTSKAKRLRYFLQSADTSLAARTLFALWEYRQAVLRRENREDPIKDAKQQLDAILTRLRAVNATTTVEKKNSSIDREVYRKLLGALQELSKLDPHPRGYAFEAFLKDLFNSFGLEAREAFRLRGEQIDGSFLLHSETYNLEAKWQNRQTGAEELHAFHGKLEQKAAWARGLFVSFSGFSEDGLHAFGRGKRVVCVDGYDLSELLMKELPLIKVLDLKVRRAAETGKAFVRVRDLLPG